jgi:hypothetical protein
MKKTFLFVALLSFTSGLYAQQQLLKGNSFFSGGVGFSQDGYTSKNQNYPLPSQNTISNISSTSTLSLLGDYGFFVSDFLVVGAGVSFFIYNNEVEYDYGHNLNFLQDGYEQTTLGFYGRLFSRYYIPLGDKLFFFPEFNVVYGMDFTENYTTTIQGTYKDNSSNQNMFLVGFGAGVSYFVSKNASLDLNFGFAGWNNSRENSESFNNDGDLVSSQEMETNSFQFNFSMAQLFLGFSVFF